mgnify:CR=1 FL=1
MKLVVKTEGELLKYLEENLDMIKETCAYLKSKKKHVFYDAEHFFTAYFENKDYKTVYNDAIKKFKKQYQIASIMDYKNPDVFDEILKCETVFIIDVPVKE